MLHLRSSQGMERGREVKRLGPDDNWCKKCGEPVRYASVPAARTGLSFDSKQVVGGGYALTEQDDGQWVATYTRVDNRIPGAKGYRKHSCRTLRADNLGLHPVLHNGIWILIEER